MLPQLPPPRQEAGGSGPLVVFPATVATVLVAMTTTMEMMSTDMNHQNHHGLLDLRRQSLPHQMFQSADSKLMNWKTKRPRNVLIGSKAASSLLSVVHLELKRLRSLDKHACATLPYRMT
jgi:hypothetical protein